VPDDPNNDAPTTNVPSPLDPDATLGSVGPQPASVAAARLPSTIGRYRIIRLLGEGGMGAVYEAEQDQPRRRVALKVIKSAWADRDLLRRFELESQTLGRLHHPGIAQIYEAGAAETSFGSQPFFAMEIIQGKPLIEYADSKRPNTQQRLALMIQICEAVEHAHQRGIIHRDLKPGNILVDDAGQPKILDFGLARVTDGDMQATRQTDMGQLLGTLAYMSPEQVTADPLALDTRSDVYALGVILYELLAGRLPYEVSRSVYEVVKTIQQVDPKPLSTINRSYRGDIETIVAKALEKDKTRRYGSAAEMAADIRRYLEDRPIAAKPASTAYQLQKFARRNKVLVGGALAVFLTLVVGVVVSTWQAVRARRAEVHARAEAATAQAIVDFLQNDLLAQASANKQAGPKTKPDPDLKVRTALDRAAERIGGKFEKQPEVEAAIRDTIGQTYDDLGLYPEARQQFERALDLERRTLGPNDPRTLRTLTQLGGVASDQSKYPEAEALLTQAVEGQRRVLGPEHRDTLDSMNSLAAVYFKEGKYAQAEASYTQILEVERRVLGPDDIALVRPMNNLALVYDAQGKYAQAETLHGQNLELERRVLGPDHPYTLMTMNNLANLYYAESKYKPAEELHSQATEIYRRVLGPEHPETLRSMANLANVYVGEGKLAEAETLDDQVLELRRRVLGPDHQSTLYSLNGLADVYAGQGKLAQAEALYSQAIEGRRRVLGPEHPDTLVSMSSLADTYQAEGKYKPAEALYLQTVELRRRVLGPEHPYTLSTTRMLAYNYLTQRKFAPAETLFTQTLEAQRRAPGPEDPDTLTTMLSMSDLYKFEHKYAQAEALASQTLEIRRRVLGPDHPDTLVSGAELAIILSHERQLEKADTLLQQMFQKAKQSQNQSALGGAWYSLACAAAAAGKIDAAIDYLRKGQEITPQPAATLANDDDMRPLRKDPRFIAIVAKAKRTAALPQPSK
jgi:eukaryotic-like serine/threonine-protein kinase